MRLDESKTPAMEHDGLRQELQGGQRRVSAAPTILAPLVNGRHAMPVIGPRVRAGPLALPTIRHLARYFFCAAAWIAFQSNFSASAIASSSVMPP